MYLNIKYWNADNEMGLFDPDSPQAAIQGQLDVYQSALLYRNEHGEIFASSSNSKIKESGDLLNIQKINNRFAIANSNRQEDFCLVVGNREKQDNGVSWLLLKQKSVIKLGKSKIVIDKVILDKKARIKKKSIYQEVLFTAIEPKNRIQQSYYEDSTKASTFEEAPICKYCYRKSIEQDNLLLVLCKCEGSTKYVHDQCLKQWICKKSNYKQEGEYIFSANKAKLICEICKDELKVEDTLPCFKENKLNQYIVLTLQFEDKKQVNIIFLPSDKDSVIKFGRKQQIDIRVFDISVSREHCQLVWKFEQGKLYIQDLNSKFGTLLKKQGLEIAQPTYMQRGKTRFLFSLEEKKGVFSSFLGLMKKRSWM